MLGANLEERNQSVISVIYKMKSFIIILSALISLSTFAKWDFEFKNYHQKRSFYIDTESVIKDKEFISVDMLADFPEKPKGKGGVVESTVATYSIDCQNDLYKLNSMNIFLMPMAEGKAIGPIKFDKEYEAYGKRLNLGRTFMKLCGKEPDIKLPIERLAKILIGESQ